jgi:cobyrinic acid a,c-diamide synthase
LPANTSSQRAKSGDRSAKAVARLAGLKIIAIIVTTKIKSSQYADYDNFCEYRIAVSGVIVWHGERRQK